MEENGHHGLSSGRHTRQSAIKDVIKRVLVSASIPAKLKPTGTERDSDTRPDEMTMMPWKRGKAAAWDVTVVDMMARSWIGHSLTTVGHAANEAVYAQENGCLSPYLTLISVVNGLFPFLSHNFMFQVGEADPKGAFPSTTSVKSMYPWCPRLPVMQPTPTGKSQKKTYPVPSKLISIFGYAPPKGMQF